LDVLAPLEAASHADPYGYYATLVQERPFGRDERAGMWVAASAAAVEAVLLSPDLEVRPAHDRVPRSIDGAPAGAIFSRLARMNDGRFHEQVKPAVESALDAVDPSAVADLAGDLAAPLLEDGVVDLRRLLFDVPVGALALALGVSKADVARTTAAVTAFAGCIPASATPTAIEAANAGAAQLLDGFGAIVSAQAADPVRRLVRGCPMAAADPLVPVANAVGLLSQTIEATAGLIGNALVALARRPAVAAAAAADQATAAAVVREVVRYDAPIQNTRRFASTSTVVAGAEVKPGDVVLVMLAAANRDPAANSDPDAFQVDRGSPRTYTFGLGRHRCPGERFAVAIAARIVHDLLRAEHDLASLADVSYLSLVNARIPDLRALVR
jgi:cytochrome P450